MKKLTRSKRLKSLKFKVKKVSISFMGMKRSAYAIVDPNGAAYSTDPYFTKIAAKVDCDDLNTKLSNSLNKGAS